MSASSRCTLGGDSARARRARSGGAVRSAPQVRALFRRCRALSLASRNSLRALRALRSDSRDEHEDDARLRRAKRQSPAATEPAHAALSAQPRQTSWGGRVELVEHKQPISGDGNGAVWAGACGPTDAKRSRGGLPAAGGLQHQTHRGCLSAAPAGRVASSAMQATPTSIAVRTGHPRPPTRPHSRRDARKALRTTSTEAQPC